MDRKLSLQIAVQCRYNQEKRDSSGTKEEHEAQMETYGNVENDNRSRAGSGLFRLVRCDSDVTVDDPLYVHAPLWLVRYSFNDKDYRVAIAGDSGNVLKGEIPISKKKRIINYSIAMVVLLAGAILGNFGMGFLGSEDTQVGGIIMLIIAIVGIGLTALPIRTAFKVQFEKSGVKQIRKSRRKGRGGR